MTTAATQPKPGKTNTLTIRRLSDENIAALKRAAAENNRSMEAQARSVLEDYLAQYTSHRILSNADLVQEMWQLLDGEGLGPDEDLVPPRDTTMRPVDLG